MLVCPSCGRENADDARFCSYCATPLAAEGAPAREERKVITCLFCDLVGFTARAESMDPEDVRRVLHPYHAQVRAELERFGGTVEKFIGDAVMAVFGAPVVHEDDPERAVRAALAIREWAAEEELELRIGITTGEALVSLGARPEAGEGMASGDVVNTAARLQSAAPTNGILVDETTYRATERVISYDEARPVEAKGKREPVPVWEAREAKARFGVDVRHLGGTELVGRSGERDALLAALERARRAREPQLVTLVGVPGIGKSRLVWELFQYADAEPGITNWRQGRSLPYGDGMSFWALAEIVKAQAGILETDGEAQASAKLRAAVAAVIVDDDASWLEGHLRPLFGLETQQAGDDRRVEAFAAWRRFLELVAEERPLVLVFEDLHWADDALLDFVDHLADWARGVPLLVLVTARPELLERRPSWGGGKPNATTLSLSPLSDEETSQLVHALLAAPVVDAETRDVLLARAGGNPLYAEEFARLVAAGRSPDELPESVQGLIAARLDALSEEEKAVVRGASVVGRVFWLGAASAVSGSQRWTAEGLLHALERKEFVRRERRSSVAGETEYVFRHLLVRDVAYAQIPRGERARRHVDAAEWIESLGRADDHAETVAHHYLAALDLARVAGMDDVDFAEKCRAAAVAAGERSVALNAFTAAARWYSRALDLMPGNAPERPQVLRRLGLALHNAADERAEEVLNEASLELVAAGRPDEAADVHISLSALWVDRGRRDRSLAEVERALALLGETRSPSKARALARLAGMQLISGDHEGAIRLTREALVLADEFELDDVRVSLLNTRGLARLKSGDASGRADVELSLKVALASGANVGLTYNNVGWMHFLAGDVRRDEELRHDARRHAERLGDERMLRFLRSVVPEQQFYLGGWEVSASEADAFIAEREAGSSHYMESNVRWVRALICLARGDVDGAAADALRSEERARESNDRQLVLSALAVRLRVELERDDAEAAGRLVDELLALPPEHAARPASIELALATRRLGRDSAIRSWIERIRYRSLWTDAALALVDAEFARAADIFSDIGSLPDEAAARMRAAEQLGGHGRTTQANEQLERALAFWRSVGATRYIMECEELLGEASEVSA